MRFTPIKTLKMQGKGFEHSFSHKKIMVSPVDLKKSSLISK